MSLRQILDKKQNLFTYQNSSEIPQCPGTYAWFFPLYLFDEHESVQELAECYRKIFAVDSLFEGSTYFIEKDLYQGRQTRSWQSVSSKSEILISPDGRLPSDCQDIWDAIRNDPAKNEIFSDSLIAASLFMPPLYIGKSNDLKARYNAHIKDSGFKARFDEFTSSEGIPLSVHDLLFVCLSLDVSKEDAMEEKLSDESNAKNMNYLLEQILMKAATPPFSKK